jgi:hypothetical protein
MSDRLLQEGGPHKITKVGQDQYSLSITIPADEDGRIARECHGGACSPGYFKVKSGTGITDAQEIAYCPYCRHSAAPSDFSTQEQQRYAKDIVLEEARQGVDRMLRNTLGLGASGSRKIGGGLVSIEMSVKSTPKRSVPRPFEEEVRRDVVCPHCTLAHSVYGLATWCADCGEDIFPTHVQAELAVVVMMVNDVPRRREAFGVRVAAKDLENSLEDVVSIFEAVLRVLAKRHLLDRGDAAEEVEKIFKRIGNAFQNVQRTAEIFRQHFALDPFTVLASGERAFLEETFAKRHLITHNLGVVDRKYIDKARTAEREGQEVLVSEIDILNAADLSKRVFTEVHRRFFQSSPSP